MSTYLDGRTWTPSARYVVRGNGTGAIVKVPFVIRTDRYGAATARLEVQAANHLLDSFLPQEGDLDPFGNDLVFSPGSLEVTYGPNAWGMIACEFAGIKQARDVARRKNSLSERSVKLTKSGVEGALTVTYKGPQTVYTYARADDPVAPEFRGELEPSADSYEIINITGPSGEDLGALVNFATLQSEGWLHHYEVRTDTFDREEDESGAVWRCTEVNQGIVLPGLTS
jgi:hypothetical protein